MQELGGSIARQLTQLANRSIPYHRHHAQLMNGGWLGGQEALGSSLFSGFESSLVWEFKLFFQEFSKICDFWGP